MFTACACGPVDLDISKLEHYLHRTLKCKNQTSRVVFEYTTQYTLIIILYLNIIINVENPTIKHSE